LQLVPLITSQLPSIRYAPFPHGISRSTGCPCMARLLVAVGCGAVMLFASSRTLGICAIVTSTSPCRCRKSLPPSRQQLPFRVACLTHCVPLHSFGNLPLYGSRFLFPAAKIPPAPCRKQ
jgi:hypothetical protein